ncbi:unnamed protein product [Prunus armeniaca]|uniref:F-box domain-containing protein n=1 Tax=Prunus armeniaca TaxID=36596 RepID=A0A6J5WQH1_PRUAR|nr:unnamed protein product [Prunus armeniaca]
MSVDSSFGKLPDHLLIEIFIRVPVSEWAQISCVKKQWANLFRGECLWQAALATTYPLANQAKRWPGPIPRGLSKRRFAALYVSKHIFSLDGEIDEIVGHTYLFLKEQLELSTMPPSSSILHGTIIDQFIACGKSRDMAHDLASQIWLAVLDNLEENEHTFQILKRLAQEGDWWRIWMILSSAANSFTFSRFFFHTPTQDQSKSNGGCLKSSSQIFATALIM